MVPKTARRAGREESSFPERGRNIAEATESAEGPDMRIIATPPFPRGVETAAMVVDVMLIIPPE
jgi:hypothetical protein